MLTSIDQDFFKDKSFDINTLIKHLIARSEWNILYRSSNVASRDSVIKFVHDNTDFEDGMSFYSANGKILEAISLLLLYKILLNKDDESDILFWYYQLIYLKILFTY